MLTKKKIDDDSLNVDLKLIDSGMEYYDFIVLGGCLNMIFHQQIYCSIHDVYLKDEFQQKKISL